MLIQENSFIRNSNYYHKLDYHSNSLSPVNMTINIRFYNFLSNLSVMQLQRCKSTQELSHACVMIECHHTVALLRTENERSRSAGKAAAACSDIYTRFGATINQAIKFLNRRIMADCFSKQTLSNFELDDKKTPINVFVIQCDQLSQGNGVAA